MDRQLRGFDQGVHVARVLRHAPHHIPQAIGIGCAGKRLNHLLGQKRGRSGRQHQGERAMGIAHRRARSL